MTETVEKDRQRIEAYRRELSQDPRSLVFIGLAETLNRLSEWDEAARVARKGLEAHPDSVAGRLALAVAEAGRDNIRDALEQIKSALIIDQENPRALALMGSLLLQKGLAKRAIQFLSQAAKLAPDSREYVDLLRRAKRLAKSETPIQLPVVRGDQVEEDNPWSDEGAEPTEYAGKKESEHTVFNPDALQKLRPEGNGSRVYKPLEDDDEKTKGRDDGRKSIELPPPRRVPENPDPYEERTTYNAKNMLLEPVDDAAPKRKPKVGGSAADYSKMIRPSEIPPPPVPEPITVDHADAKKLRAPPDEGPTTRLPSQLEPPSAPPPAPSPIVSAPPVPPPPPAAKSAMIGPPAQPPKEAKPVSAPKSMPPAPPPPDPVEQKIEAPHPPAPAKMEGAIVADDATKDERALAKAKAKAERDAAKEAAASEKVTDPPKAAPKPAPGADRPATMMVDDAIWAIYGGEKPAAKPAAGGVSLKVEEPEKAAPAAAPKPAKEKKAEAAAEEDAGAAQRPGVMVVRTSSWFAGAAYWAFAMILAGGAAWLGYSLSVTRSGKSVLEATEDLRGVFSDVERGSLASLLAADEGIKALIQNAPELKPMLQGALAEVHARIWADFGGDPKMREEALADLREVDLTKPTVEVLAAQAALSTSAASLAQIDQHLEKTLEDFPDSPKAWLLKARIAEQNNNLDGALNALYAARDLHPARRQTLLDLARWHARRGSYGSAFAYFEELQERYPEDVQAALERYVLGQVSGRDPAANEAKSKLAGLVRDEIPEVAKDEAGRVALAFSVEAFASGDFESGLGQLTKAEAAFQSSARFKETLGIAFLAAGEWDRAKAQLERALELEPDEDNHRIGIALAAYAKLAGLARSNTAPQQKTTTGGRALLPFGTLELDASRFALVKADVSSRHFPIVDFRAMRARARGGELSQRLEARGMVEVAKRRRIEGKIAEASELLEKARSTYEDAPLYTELGRLQLAKKDLKAAVRSLETAVKLDKNDVEARVALAEAKAQDKDLAGAVEVLEPAISGGVVVPRAYLLLAELKAQRGDDPGARKLLEEVALIDPENADVLRALGRSEHRLKQEDAALERFQKALAVQKSLSEAPKKAGETRGPIDLYYLGRALVEKGEKSEKRGVELLEAALDSEEAPPEARFYLGKTLIKRPRTKRQGKRELELFRKAMPEGDLALQAERLLKGR